MYGKLPPVGATPFNCNGAVPEQIVWFALIDPTTKGAITVMVIIPDVAGFPVIHAAFDVMTQITASLFAGIYA